METKKLYVYFLNTLSHCGSFIFDSSKEDIEYQIFEEFDIGIISFLHENSLKQLLDSKLITSEVYNKCLLLRKQVFELQELDLWKIDLIKTNEKWSDVILLCDEIKYMILSRSIF